METSTTESRVYPAYDVMIKRLFKVMNDVPYASAMHAAIGLSGEAAELLDASSRKNILEELGDIEFYIEALKQQFAPDIDGALAIRKVDLRGINLNVGAVFVNVVTLTGDILDLVKKSWVYNSELKRAEITKALILLELNLSIVYEMFGTTKVQICHLNQVKLVGPGGRFESGFYSNEAAIARADKVGEDRTFIGKDKPVWPYPRPDPDTVVASYAQKADPDQPVGKLIQATRVLDGEIKRPDFD